MNFNIIEIFYFVTTIIEYYELFNNETMIDVRYNQKNTFNNHPRIKEIKGSYKFVKPAKLKKIKFKIKK